MGLKLITGPGSGSPSDAEPVSLAEALAHLRDPASEDALISALITAARTWAEDWTNRAFLTQTWDFVLDAFPAGILELPKGRLQSITSITYIDNDGTTQTLTETTDYKVDTTTDPGRVAPAYGEVWPVTRTEPNAVTIRFVAGYGDIASAVPQPIKQAILLMIGHLFENREAVQSAGDFYRLPLGAEALLAPYRIIRWD